MGVLTKFNDLTSAIAPKIIPREFREAPLPVHREAPGGAAFDGKDRAGAAHQQLRVLHVINGEHYSGAERVQDLLAARLPDCGFDVGFACVKPGRFPHARESKLTALHVVPMSGKFDLRAAWRLRSIILDGGYSILHAHTPRSALVGRLAARAAGVPMVYHVHSPTDRDSTRGVHNRINSYVERTSLWRVPHIITVSESLARHMECRGFAEDRLHVVHNGVPRPAAVPHHQQPTGQWTLGTVALFRPRKGTEVLIEAMGMLRRRGHDLSLRAVGPFESPEYADELKMHVREQDLQRHVKWVGFKRDVAAEFAQMDLFVLPSLFGEGLPMVVLEAMASGVPVVATRVEGVPEAVRDGMDGVIANPESAEDLARAIEQVITGQIHWSMLRDNALARHAELFSDESMAQGVAEVYRKVLHSGVRT